MEPIRYISLFSGIEAATVAWHPLGWQPVAFSEVDKFCCELLKHYYPEVPNLGDVTKITREQIEALGHVDVVVFGSPCQDLSVAGQRGGLKDGTRSNLFFAGVQVARWSKARFALWENVPGAFSSNHGDDFGTVVGSLVGVAGVPVPHCRWRNEGVAVGPLGMAEWAVLDAQWFGVAQRRRRVFVVLDTGDWASRSPILLEPHRLRGDPPTRGEAGEGVTGKLGAGPQGSCTDTERMTFVPEEVAEPIAANEARTYTHEGNMFRLRNCVQEVVPALTSEMAKGTGGPAGDECQNLVLANSLRASDGHHGHRSPCGDGHDNLIVGGQVAVAIPIIMRDALRTAGNGAGTAGMGVGSDGDPGPTLGTSSCIDAVAVQDGRHVNRQQNGLGIDASGAGYTVDTTGAQAVATHMAIRRLLPSECEALQGFSRGYTLIPRRPVPAKGQAKARTAWRAGDGRFAEIDGVMYVMTADGPRYRAIGNSMAVPVMRWIGRRIQAVLEGDPQ